MQIKIHSEYGTHTLTANLYPHRLRIAVVGQGVVSVDWAEFDRLVAAAEQFRRNNA